MALLRTASPPTPVAETAVVPFEALGRAGVLWAHPAGGLSAAAFGESDRREGPSLRAVLSGLGAPGDLPEHMPGPWFGAAAFDGTMGPDWSGFSPLRFTLPSLLAWRHEGRQFVAAFGDAAEARLDEARRRLDAASGHKHAHHPDHDHEVEHHAQDQHQHQLLTARRLQSDRRHWDALVSRALSSIAAGTLDKVVLARAIDVESPDEIDPSALLASLQSQNAACRAFLFRGRGGRSFLGATPELLCRIDGDRISTEALAGSARPDSAAALLLDGKELREHRWVVDHVVQALSGIASDVQRKLEPGLRRLANIVHLHTPIEARLAPGRGVADVASALHPTPAVAGVPAEAALRFLSEHEQLDRGLYAGLVGWVGPDRAELAVALRCALVRGRRARLFVGAGIVEGSSAESEWAETELKARPLLGALGVAP